MGVLRALHESIDYELEPITDVVSEVFRCSISDGKLIRTHLLFVSYVPDLQ